MEHSDHKLLQQHKNCIKLIEETKYYIEIHLEFILNYITLTCYFIVMEHSDHK